MKAGLQFVTLFFITCFAAKADISVFGNSPSSPGSIALSSGYANPEESYWCAIGFTPQENIDLSSVTLWLSGFNGQNGQEVGVSIELNDDNPEDNVDGTASNFPNYDFLDFSSPAANNGSLTAFTFSNPSAGSPYINPSGSTVLLANTEYWLEVIDYGNGGVPTQIDWAAGETPVGEAVYDGSATDNGVELAWDTASGLPAFSINIAPEPSAAAIMMVPLLLGAGRKLFKARQPLL